MSLRDAFRVLQTETSAYLVAQPPPSRGSDNAAAVAVIAESLTVLSRAAVAGSGSAEQRRAAFKAVVSEYQHVEKLQTKLVG